MRELRGYYINVNDGTHGEKIVDDDLDKFYEILDCGTIDITVRRVGGKDFNFVVDDEGLLKPNKVSATTSDGETMLVGNLFICLDDGEGNLTSLSDDDISLIDENVVAVFTKDYGEQYYALAGCEYAV